jgi:ribonuclease P protein subunit Rpp21 (EC 3.1.26.5)
MKDKRRIPPGKPLARERIAVLFHEAERIFPEHPEYSDRYVEIARKIAMRERVRIDTEFRRRYCHHCYRYFVPWGKHAGPDAPGPRGCHLPVLQKNNPVPGGETT